KRKNHTPADQMAIITAVQASAMIFPTAALPSQTKGLGRSNMTALQLVAGQSLGRAGAHVRQPAWFARSVPGQGDGAWATSTPVSMTHRSACQVIASQ